MVSHKGAEIRELSAKSADELVKLLLSIKQEQPSAIFRGQSRSDWKLVPSLWRSEDAKTQVDRWLATHYGFEMRIGKEWVESLSGDMLKRAQRLSAWLHVEQNIASKFIDLCERCALPYPRSEQKFSPACEYSNEFNVPYPVFSPWIAFAQHYGLPTRLLDFSDNPLKAVYFAINDGDLGLASAYDFEIVAAVRFGRGMSQLDIHGAESKRALRGEIPYLHAQDGLFIDGRADATSFFMSNGSWPDCMTKIMDGWVVTRITCAGAFRHELAQQLKVLGINKMTMKPSPETAAGLIKESVSSFDFLTAM